jgi:hypothetical protein
MDATGALIGPIVAFAILGTIQNGYDAVFVASLSSAVVGLAVLVLLVQNPGPAQRPPLGSPSIAAAIGLLRMSAFQHAALATLALGAMTMSDAFVYLSLQRGADMSARALPLFYVITSAFYLVFAIPVGKLADTIGRFNVFLAGHIALIALYLILLTRPSAAVAFAVALPILGVYYAATEGVLMAVGSSFLPEALRTSGLALLTTILAIARFGASVLFGLLWVRFELEIAVTVFLVGLSAGIVLVAATRPRTAS